MESLKESTENKNSGENNGIKEERLKVLKGSYKTPILKEFFLQNTILGDCSDMVTRKCPPAVHFP